VSQRDPRASQIAEAMQWVSRITTVGFEFAVPPLLAWFLDRWWGTTPWMTIGGAILGFAVGMQQLLQMARQKPRA
jgi:F0F1-type ATP synthase assembly protein I